MKIRPCRGIQDADLKASPHRGPHLSVGKCRMKKKQDRLYNGLKDHSDIKTVNLKMPKNKTGLITSEYHNQRPIGG